MQRALEEVQNRGAGLNAAFHEYSAPQAALIKHLDAKNHFVVVNTQESDTIGGSQDAEMVPNIPSCHYMLLM
jgi:hypothetical protein